ncbi:MAG: polyprenyl synthetase family protein [Mycobacterium sp.]
MRTRVIDMPRAEAAPSVDDIRSVPAAPSYRAPAAADAAWRTDFRSAVLDEVAEFIAARAGELDGAGLGVAGDMVAEFVSGGKCVRSTFMYLGWLCGAAPSAAALRAAASVELLHGFALIQDDVMDDSAERRGLPAVHVQLAQWHRERGLPGSARRFGESGATLLGDLCMIWAEQMLRDSGVEQRRLQRVWPRYDAMRAELAIGQFADLMNDVRGMPSLESVLDVARRKSGNYTVRRPLEIGAAMAGCDERLMAQLGRYGSAIGEAFQLRDDILGVFGAPAETGKPTGGDLLERKATSLVVTACELADAPTAREITALMNTDELDDTAIDRWRTLILESGALRRIEDLIDFRLTSALTDLAEMAISDPVRAELADLAAACGERSQ